MRRRLASATASVPLPAGNVVRTVFVAGSITEIVPSSMFGTQSSPPTQAEASGLWPTGICARTAPVAGSSLTTTLLSPETQSASADGVIQSACGTG